MAENKDGQEKSEPASAKRLQEARQRGQVSKSIDVTTAVILLFGTITFLIFGGPMIDSLKEFMKETFRGISTIQITQSNIITHFKSLLLFLASILLPILTLIFIVTLATEISQTGIQLATKKFTEGAQLKQLKNPFSGLKKIFFSSRSFFELGKSIAKILVLGFVAYTVLDDNAIFTLSLVQMSFYEIAEHMARVTFELMIKVGLVYILIAVVDYFYQKYKFKEDMKMTKQEVKEEGKQAEGDPKVKAHLRSLMRGRIRRLMMKNVEEADVVITNPTHFAVALKYKPGAMNAPVVVAKGADFLAAQIRKKANENDIPIVEEPPLARALFFSVDVDQPIPENLFKAVAQILAYVYHLKK